jgi:hypothetical protein
MSLHTHLQSCCCTPLRAQLNLVSGHYRHTAVRRHKSRSGARFNQVMVHRVQPLAAEYSPEVLQLSTAGSGNQSMAAYYCQGRGQPDVAIKVGGTTFAAHSSLLRMFSTCAEGMPGPFTEWDLNLINVGGLHPPAATVVAAWLEALYWYQGGQHAPKTLQEALPVLRFADAVGSPAGFMNALVDRIMDNWSLSITASSNAPVRIPLTAACPWYVIVRTSDTFYNSAICSVAHCKDWASLQQLYAAQDPCVEELRKFRRDSMTFGMAMNLVSQLEELLYWSHRLKLEKLAQVLHAFTRRQCSVPGAYSLFHGAVKPIMSSRVVQSVDFQTAAEAWAKYITCTEEAAGPWS